MATGYCSGQEASDKMGNLFRLILFTSVFSMSYTKECEMRSYYDRIQEGRVPCGEYPAGCNALDNVTQTNCLTNCKSKFIFLVKLCRSLLLCKQLIGTY